MATKKTFLFIYVFFVSTSAACPMLQQQTAEDLIIMLHPDHSQLTNLLGSYLPTFQDVQRLFKCLLHEWAKREHHLDQSFLQEFYLVIQKNRAEGLIDPCLRETMKSYDLVHYLLLNNAHHESFLVALYLAHQTSPLTPEEFHLMLTSGREGNAQECIKLLKQNGHHILGKKIAFQQINQEAREHWTNKVIRGFLFVGLNPISTGTILVSLCGAAAFFTK